MALVVYVFATVLMLAAGLEQTLVATGQDDNVVVIRRAAQTEVQSGIDRQQAAIVETPARHRDRRRRQPAGVAGAGGPDQPAQARQREAVERRDPRRHAGGRRAAAAGADRRGADVPPGHLGDRHRPRDRQRLHRRRASARRMRFASRDWTVVGNFDAGRTGLRLGDLGRRRADAAGVPPAGVLVADLQARRSRPLRRGEAGARVRPAAHARGQARDAVLRRPVGDAVEVHQLPRRRRSRRSSRSARSSAR